METELEKEESKEGGEEQDDQADCADKSTKQCEQEIGEKEISEKVLLKRDLVTDIKENKGGRRQKTHDDMSTAEEEETTSKLEEYDDEDSSEDDEDSEPSGMNESSSRASVNQFSSLMYVWMKTVVDVKPVGMAPPIKKNSKE